MDRRVIMCVDGQSLRNPAMVGLAGEPLEGLPWLECATSAEQCRAVARRLVAAEEAWVVSCDDMEPINVAAAIKHDDSRKRVYVVSCGQNGSMASRVANAKLDGLWSESQFLKRFCQVKRAFSAPTEMASLDDRGSLRAGAGGDAAARRGQSVETAPLATAAPPPRSISAPSSKGVRATAPRTSFVAQAPERAFTVAVVGGSGGCGKSTIAAIAAALSAKAGLACIAVDADLQFGDLHHLLGAKEPLRIEEAIAEPARLDRLGDEAGKGAVAVLAAPRRPEMSEEVAPELAPVLARVGSLCDVAVVNTGAFWSDAQATVFDAANAVLFVMDARPSSLRTTAQAVELCARLGVATTSFSFVVNRHERESLLSAVDVSCSLRGAHAAELPHGGRDVDELLGAGYVQPFLDSRNSLADAVSGLLAKVLPEGKREAVLRLEEGQPRKRRSLFGKGR